MFPCINTVLQDQAKAVFMDCHDLAARWEELQNIMIDRKHLQFGNQDPQTVFEWVRHVRDDKFLTLFGTLRIQPTRQKRLNAHITHITSDMRKPLQNQRRISKDLAKADDTFILTFNALRQDDTAFNSPISNNKAKETLTAAAAALSVRMEFSDANLAGVHPLTSILIKDEILSLGQIIRNYLPGPAGHAELDYFPLKQSRFSDNFQLVTATYAKFTQSLENFLDCQQISH